MMIEEKTNLFLLLFYKLSSQNDLLFIEYFNIAFITYAYISFLQSLFF